jgi:hypothetical protein
MKSVGYFEDRKIFASVSPAVDQQGSIRVSPEFGLISLKG